MAPRREPVPPAPPALVTVWCYQWEERERDLYMQRPDGFSLHATEEHALRTQRAVCAALPDEAPDEYELPIGDPYPILVPADLAARVAEASAVGGRLRYLTPKRAPGRGQTFGV